MDNAHIHLRIKNFNPGDAQKQEAPLRKYALDLCVDLGGDFGADLAPEANPELVSFVSIAAGRGYGKHLSYRTRLGI